MDFSATLAATTTRMLPHIDSEYYFSPTENEIGDMLELAFRNEKANYIILTGEEFGGGEYKFLDAGNSSANDILTKLYTYEWGDDGRTVAGLTDWIGDYQESLDGSRVEMGNDAFIELVELTASLEEEFNNTGHSVEDENHGVTWEDASVGLLNPEIANSFADLFMANIDAMESSIGIEQLENGNGAYGDKPVPDPRYSPEGLIRLNPSERLAFTEFIAGSEEAISRLQAEVFLNNEAKMQDYLNGSGQAGDTSIPQEIGIVSGLLDEAVAQESEARVNRQNADIDYQNSVNSNRIDILSAVANELSFPGVSTVSEIIKVTAKEALKEDLVNAAEVFAGGSGMRDQIIPLENRAILYHLSQKESFEGYDFIEIENMHNSEGVFTTDWSQWRDANGDPLDDDASRLALNAIREEILEERPENSSDDLNDLFIGFGNGFDDYIDAMNPSAHD